MHRLRGDRVIFGIDAWNAVMTLAASACRVYATDAADRVAAGLRRGLREEVESGDELQAAEARLTLVGAAVSVGHSGVAERILPGLEDPSPRSRSHCLPLEMAGGHRMYPPGNDNATSPPLYGSEAGVRSRCRSFCFLEREGVRWTAFLITYQRAGGHWRGYFTFRSAIEGADVLAEVRTADLFVERSEEEVDARARGLGRPLVVGLLESAIETDARRRGSSPDVQRWFRDMLRRHAASRARRGVVAGAIPAAASEAALTELRSQYESYRLDQVAHLIALLQPADFREIVELRLEGRRIDFNSRDRFQHAMSIVQEIEKRLPLPPFEVWVEDYLANADEYDRYSRALHGSGELP